MRGVLECGSLLPLSCPRACSREFQAKTQFAASKLAGLSSENAICSQQAGWRKSGSKLPHSKAGCARKCRRVDMGKNAPAARERFACTQEAICDKVFSGM